MIKINLLPYRASRKIENIRRQVTVFLLAFAMIMTAMFYYNMTLGQKVNQLNTKVEDIKIEVAKVERQAKKVDQIKKTLDTLNKKIEVIRNLEFKREEAVRLLDNMTQVVTEKGPNAAQDALEAQDSSQYKRLWFTSLQASGNSISISGIALDNKTVADFMTRLETSNLYTNVNLKTLRRQTIKNLDLKSFDISCEKTTGQDTEKK
ncbi:MAG: PilN domain-containing protein [Proteobacteria bacterium]|nr:PilN domain-containing protein [Pseudomonadota bacterium]